MRSCQTIGGLMNPTKRMSAGSSSWSKLVNHGTPASSDEYEWYSSCVHWPCTNMYCSSTGIKASSRNNLVSNHKTTILTSWLQSCWGTHNIRHEQVAVGIRSPGVAVMTGREMEIHIMETPDIRGMLDCIPVADIEDFRFIGWRKKAWTFPCSKHETLRAEQFALFASRA